MERNNDFCALIIGVTDLKHSKGDAVVQPSHKEGVLSIKTLIGSMISSTDYSASICSVFDQSNHCCHVAKQQCPKKCRQPHLDFPWPRGALQATQEIGKAHTCVRARVCVCARALASSNLAALK
eukprot:1160178-Pelagomonas_calceolata.AAC.7